MSRRKPRTSYKLLVVNLLIAGLLGGPLLIPSVRERAFVAAVSPRYPYLRNLAASFLRWHSTDASVSTLVRVVNTVGPEFNRRLAATAVASLGEIAGRPFDGDDWSETVARVNDWASERLGRPLDDNDGVLGWFPLSEKVRGYVEEIADEDPEVAWSAWSSFDVMVASSSGEFLWEAGKALGDPRPISFSIRGGGGSFEGQPDPIGNRRELQLVDTVGESLALLLWQYAGVGDDAFPDDFASWWREIARRNHLPPPAPPPTSPSAE
jgi:hypothetical protein